MRRITIICPSCIGLGKILRFGELRTCKRCLGDGRLPGIERRNIYGEVISVDPDPESDA